MCQTLSSISATPWWVTTLFKGKEFNKVHVFDTGSYTSAVCSTLRAESRNPRKAYSLPLYTTEFTSDLFFKAFALLTHCAYDEVVIVVVKNIAIKNAKIFVMIRVRNL